MPARPILVLILGALAASVMSDSAFAQAWGKELRPSDPLPTGAWIRSTTENPMSNTPDEYFALRSRDQFVRNGKSQHAYLRVGMVEGRDVVELSAGETRINCLGDLTPIRLRVANQKPFEMACDWGLGQPPDRVELRSIALIFGRLRANLPLTIQFQTYDNLGPVTVTFETTGFQWPRRGRTY